MDITDIKIFRIDFQESSVDTIDQAEFPTDFTTYLEGLINLRTSGVSLRTFRFDRDTTEVRGQLGEIIIGKDFSDIASTIATRLLSIEQNAQGKIAHLGTEIQKGIIVQALINDSDKKKYVICKADHNEFLNEINFSLSRGLPIKKKIFKGFICTLKGVRQI